MKTASKVIPFVLFLAVSSAVSADTTKIEKSTLYNSGVSKNIANVALGKDSTANAGSISIRDGAYVKDSTVHNAGSTTNAANVALGKGSTANIGSIDVR